MVGCGSGPVPTPGPTPVPQLPVDTKIGTKDSLGFYQIYTNDLYYCNKGIYMLFGPGTDNYDPMNLYPLEVNIKKVSGCPDYGFGIIFCSSWSSFSGGYRLLITTDGYYYLAKKSASGYSVIPDSNNPTPQAGSTYIQYSALNQGYDNANNHIMIVRNVDGDNHGNFKVYINDLTTPAFTFTDDTYTGGQFGFYTAVGQAYQESFPNTPVDTRFQLTSPNVSATSLHTLQNNVIYGTENL